jgi:predicted small secreted protein
MKSVTQRTLLPLVGALLVAGVFIGGCNTVEGVGRDIENLGDAIEDEADDARDNRRNRN